MGYESQGKGGGGNLHGTQFLNAELREPLAHINRCLDRFALGNASKEASSESITSTSGVGNVLFVNGVYSELLDLVLALDGDNGRLGALSDDGGALALLVGLGEVCEVLGDGWDVLGVEAVRLSVGNGLGLVSDNVVPVGSSLVELVLEKLGDERSREREHERLVLLCGLLAQSQDGGNRDGEMVSSHEVVLGLLDPVPVFLQMLDLVLVGGSQIGAHAPVMAGDDDTASAGGVRLIDSVDSLQADLLVGLDEQIGVLVLSDAAEKDDRLLRKDVLDSSGRVLGGTTGVEVCFVVVQQLLVQAHVLLLGENGVVGLEAILVEQGLVTGTTVSASTTNSSIPWDALSIRGP